MTLVNRSGEEGVKIPPRRGRFAEKEGYWYYSTREGVEIGPFDNLEAVETGAGEFIDFICASEPNIIEVLKRYRAA